MLKITKLVVILTCSVFFISNHALANSAADSLIGTVEPGGNSIDVDMAINEPHEYAWKLFFYLNRQAKSGTAGMPDPSKNGLKEYDDNLPVVWETWANATGSLFLGPNEPNRSEVFLEKGAKPSKWAELPRKSSQNKTLEINTTTLVPELQRNIMSLSRDVSKSSIFHPLFDPGAMDEREFEVRMNKSTFNTVRNENLYSVEGLQDKLKEAKKTGNRDIIQFNKESKEVKAKWIKLTTDAQKARYHWRSVEINNPDGTKITEIWGLSGFHIITKDLPNWFWTDFEHVDQEEVANNEGRPSVDPTTRGSNAPSGSNGIRQETKGTKWQNYRLRGVQLMFTDKFGKPTRLANTLIEPISSGPSSCITCHANATIGEAINHTRRSIPLQVGTLPIQFVDGLPKPDAYFGVNKELKYIQTDFLWSLPFRARSTKSDD
jgi:hypothetical protein